MENTPSYLNRVIKEAVEQSNFLLKTFKEVFILYYNFKEIATSNFHVKSIILPNGTKVDTVNIYGVLVDKNLRGKGIGKILIKKIIEAVKDSNIQFISLEVETHNETAIKLYKSTGFDVYRETASVLYMFKKV